MLSSSTSGRCLMGRRENAEDEGLCGSRLASLVLGNSGISSGAANATLLYVPQEIPARQALLQQPLGANSQPASQSDSQCSIAINQPFLQRAELLRVYADNLEVGHWSYQYQHESAH